MMKVHIICTVPEEDRILPRMAQLLVENTGWSSGRTPRTDVSFNLFFPYLDYEPVSTKSGAYFTHYDNRIAIKTQRWHNAAKSVDLRIVTAHQYGDQLAAFGLTAYAPAPLDLKRFALVERASGMRVGMSGFLDAGDLRKGQDLMAKLVAESPRVAWTAIGRGWPVLTKNIRDDELAGWYQSLRLFVCTSRVEGVPYPPLEALAVGVPIVIPRGVGMLDDLPDIRGIYRFDAGDYASLREAFALAMSELGRADRNLLRAAVSETYTAQAWAIAHEQAIEQVVNPPVEVSLDDWHGRAGVYIVAYGMEAHACAQRCIPSIHQFMPGLPVALVSDHGGDGEDLFIYEADYDVGGRRAKLKVDALAPKDWQYVLYLDADTELIAPIDFLFDVLRDGWEFVICTNPDRFHTTREMKRPDNHEEVERTYNLLSYDDLCQLNGGVFAFRRNDRTQAFFQRWMNEWLQEAKRDQAALLRALWSVPLHYYFLPNEWNTSDRYLPVERSAGIVHHQTEARRAQGIIWARGDSPEAFDKVAEWRRLHGKE